MNVEIHIERLVLDGVALAPGGSDALGAAVQMELARIVLENGVPPALLAGGAVPLLRGPGITADTDGAPSRLGAGVAGAVYESVSR